MRLFKRLVGVVVAILLMALFLTACVGHKGSDTEPEPDLFPALTQSEVGELFHKPLDKSVSFTLEQNGYEGTESYKYSVTEDGFEMLKTEQNYSPVYYQKTTYTGRIGGVYHEVTTRVGQGQNGADALSYDRLSDAQAEMKRDSFFDMFTLSNVTTQLEKLAKLGTLYDPDFIPLTWSGSRWPDETGNKLKYISIYSGAFGLEFEGNAANAHVWTEYDSSERMTSFSLRILLHEDYVPSNYDFSYLTASDLVSQFLTIAYGNPQIAAPSLAGAADNAPEQVEIQYNGGVVDAEVLFDTGSIVELPDPEEISGLTFGGWYYDGQYKYPAGKSVNVGYRYSLPLYAKWNGANITLEPNGGTVTGTPSGFSLNACVKNLQVEKEGYIFGGWYKDEDFTQAATYDYNAITASVKLYAKWLPIIKATFSGVHDYKLLPYIGAPGETIQFPPDDAVTNKGAIFAGWYTDAQFQTPAPEHLSGSNMQLYAKFKDAFCIELRQHETIGISDQPLYVNAEKLPSPTITDFESLMEQINVGKDSGSAYGGPDGIMFKFEGWYTNSTLTAKFSGYPTADTVLYPKYVPVD